MTKYGIKVIQGNLWMKVLDVQNLLVGGEEEGGSGGIGWCGCGLT